MIANVSITDFQIINDKLYISHDLFMWWMQSIGTAFLAGMFFGVGLISVYKIAENITKKDNV